MRKMSDEKARSLYGGLPWGEIMEFTRQAAIKTAEFLVNLFKG